MPAQVLVVKRARRRAFAILWAVPVWFRSVWNALREGSEAMDEQGAADRRLAAVARARGLQIPRLKKLEAGGHACTGCGACIEICPSRCLELARVGSVGAGPGAEVIRFELDPGACIGCGGCVEICPEEALESTTAPLVLRASVAGTAPAVDLLALGEK